jgi:hypothetical protein
MAVLTNDLPSVWRRVTFTPSIWCVAGTPTGPAKRSSRQQHFFDHKGVQNEKWRESS